MKKILIISFYTLLFSYTINNNYSAAKKTKKAKVKKGKVASKKKGKTSKRNTAKGKSIPINKPMPIPMPPQPYIDPNKQNPAPTPIDPKKKQDPAQNTWTETINNIIKHIYNNKLLSMIVDRIDICAYNNPTNIRYWASYLNSIGFQTIVQSVKKIIFLDKNSIIYVKKEINNNPIYVKKMEEITGKVNPQMVDKLKCSVNIVLELIENSL